MKILMVHQGDAGLGGGQVQLLRLRDGLLRQGVDARILCRVPSREDSLPLPSFPRTERFLRKVTRRVGLNDVELVGSFRLTGCDAFKEADLVDFHCLHSGTFSYLALPRVTAEKATVFTFHDMWPLTGHCHASLECGRWRNGCGKCPHLDVYPPVARDATAVEWRLKRHAYRRSKFTIVTPSRWLMERTRESVLAGFPVHHVPHGIDTSAYQPLDKESCRSLLGVPKGKKVLLFAVERMDRPLKGADLLVKALRDLPESLKKECVLLLFGHSGGELSRLLDMPTIDLGFLSHDRLKAIAYSAADLFVNPTRAESFGLVALESIACGTPVVAFSVGGIPEVVRHGINGWLSEPESPECLRRGVCEILSDAGGRVAMGARCREIAVAEYPIELQASRYLGVYREALGGERIAGAVESLSPATLATEG